MSVMRNSIEKLRSESMLLHLAHHRNKNQHRLSKWYKSFGQLRRQLAKLIHELDNHESALSMSSRENCYVACARTRFQLRSEFLQLHIVPKSYIAFGNLVADNQYAALGLMLMGVLASVMNVLQMLNPEKENEQENKVKIIDTGSEHDDASDHLVDQSSDLGVIISREECRPKKLLCEDKDSIEHPTTSNIPIKQKIRMTAATCNRIDTLPSPSVKTRKKKRKADFFDDIFGSLV